MQYLSKNEANALLDKAKAEHPNIEELQYAPGHKKTVLYPDGVTLAADEKLQGIYEGPLEVSGEVRDVKLLCTTIIQGDLHKKGLFTHGNLWRNGIDEEPDCGAVVVLGDFYADHMIIEGLLIVLGNVYVGGHVYGNSLCDNVFAVAGNIHAKAVVEDGHVIYGSRIEASVIAEMRNVLAYENCNDDALVSKDAAQFLKSEVLDEKQRIDVRAYYAALSAGEDPLL